MSRSVPSDVQESPAPLWFGVFGSAGFYGALRTDLPVLHLVADDFNRVTFHLLDQLPMPFLTTLVVVLAAFLFIVTSVVSAAFVLGMFSTGGDPNPSTRVKLIWGVILAALMIVLGRRWTQMNADRAPPACRGAKRKTTLLPAARRGCAGGPGIQKPSAFICVHLRPNPLRIPLTCDRNCHISNSPQDMVRENHKKPG